MKKIILTAVASFTLFSAGVAHAMTSACQFVKYDSYLIPAPTISVSALTTLLTAEGFNTAAINLIIASIPKCALKP